MKKLITAFVLLAACHSSAPAPAARPVASARVLTGNQTGASDPITAVRGFMAAVKQTDLQAMGAIWGDADGPARDAYDREQLEKREFIMMCFLRHDRYDILGDAPAAGGKRSIAVSLSLGDLTRSTTFTVVRGPAARWYVENVDVKELEALCSKRS